ncbi:hypothetical protein ABW20_dc0102031 [Dactylellina cionopaga]|nr:hypothetical protein ABW20_dc0102031 [Dactylellina cionopaga]
MSVAVFIVAASTLNTAARYVAMMFMPATVYAGYVCALSWISATLPRPVSKRAAALAAINAVSNASQIGTAYMYTKSSSPRYAIAMGVNCGTSLLAVVFAIVLRTMLVRLNKKLDRGEEVGGTGPSRSTDNVALTQDEIHRREEEGLPGAAAAKGFRFLI